MIKSKWPYLARINSRPIWVQVMKDTCMSHALCKIQSNGYFDWDLTRIVLEIQDRECWSSITSISFFSPKSTRIFIRNLTKKRSATLEKIMSILLSKTLYTLKNSRLFILMVNFLNSLHPVFAQQILEGQGKFQSWCAN